MTVHYPAGFWQWYRSADGQRVWKDFERRALEMATVRKHYGAKAIIEVIRWDTALRGGTDFKMNNNWAPGLARRWLSKHGRQHPGFFRLRDAFGNDEVIVHGQKVPF